MNKQEEIRKEVEYCIRYADYDDNDEIKVEALTAKILGVLHYRGDVVIKVDRGCDACGGEGTINQAICPNCMGIPKRVAVEPLIEEV